MMVSPCVKESPLDYSWLALALTLYQGSFYFGAGCTYPASSAPPYLTTRLRSPLFGELQRLPCLGGGRDGRGGQSLGCSASLATWFATPLPRLMLQDGLCATVHAALIRDHISRREGALGNHHCRRKTRRREGCQTDRSMASCQTICMGQLHIHKPCPESALSLESRANPPDTQHEAVIEPRSKLLPCLLACLFASRV